MSDEPSASVQIAEPAARHADDPAPEPEKRTAQQDKDDLAGTVDTTDPTVAARVRAELIDNLKVLRAFAISLTRNGSAADDLVQETILKAWANLHRFEPGTNMRAWLFTILRNTFYSDRHKAARVVSDSEGDLAGQLASKPTHDGRLNMRDFRTAFAELPDEQREVLILVGALGHSYDEAAEMCGVRIGTIKSRLNRGRARLAELMHVESDEAMELTDRATAAVMASQGYKVF